MECLVGPSSGNGLAEKNEKEVPVSTRSSMDNFSSARIISLWHQKRFRWLASHIPTPCFVESRHFPTHAAIWCGKTTMGCKGGRLPFVTANALAGRVVEAGNRTLRPPGSEQTEGGERMNCVFGIWMSEQAEEGERMPHALHLEDVWMPERTNRGKRTRTIFNIWMPEQTEEGSACLSIWISYQTGEGGRMSCILNIWMSEQTEGGERLNCMLEHLDVRTDRRMWTHEQRLEHLDVRKDWRWWAQSWINVDHLDVRTWGPP